MVRSQGNLEFVMRLYHDFLVTGFVEYIHLSDICCLFALLVFCNSPEGERRVRKLSAKLTRRGCAQRAIYRQPHTDHSKNFSPSTTGVKPPLWLRRSFSNLSVNLSTRFDQKWLVYRAQGVQDINSLPSLKQFNHSQVTSSRQLLSTELIRLSFPEHSK